MTRIKSKRAADRGTRGAERRTRKTIDELRRERRGASGDKGHVRDINQTIDELARSMVTGRGADH